MQTDTFPREKLAILLKHEGKQARADDAIDKEVRATSEQSDTGREPVNDVLSIAK